MTDWQLPKRGLFVTGTDTEVGKTWVSAHILRFLQQNSVEKPLQICARKPVASGACIHNGVLTAEDTLQLAHATNEPLEQVTRYTFAPPTSPAHAAQLADIDTALDKLLQACRVPPHSWTLVEGAGGFYSPLGSDNSLNSDLATALKLPVLLVVGHKLGCINHTLLTLAAIEQRGLHCIGVVLNDLHDQRNTGTAEALRALITPPLYTMPYGQPDIYWPHWLSQLLQFVA
jgi:dethiobiotin synthetase